MSSPSYTDRRSIAHRRSKTRSKQEHAARAHRRFPILSRRTLISDFAMLILAAAVSIASWSTDNLGADIFEFAIFGVAVLGVLAVAGIYRTNFAPHFLDDAGKVIGATAIVAMTMTFAQVLFFDSQGAADQAVRAWIFAATYMIAARGAIHLVEMRLRKAGLAGENTLIVGAGAVGRQFAQRLVDRPEFGLRPVAFLDDDPLEIDSPVSGDIPVLHSGSPAPESAPLFGPGLELAIAERQVTHVIVSFSSMRHHAELDLVRRCQAMGVTVSVLPRLFEGVTDRIGLERIGGIPIISVHPTDPLGWQFAIKYAGDRFLAAVAIIVSSPVMIIAALATALTLGRPIIFSQRRVGLDGREFNLYKFRTMRDARDGEASEVDLDDRLHAGLAPGGVEGVDRRTRVGTWLRKTAIDELPQLFNVLRGDMSLVGPRPERPSYARLFDESVYRYADRHRVKSGLTGWSQVHGLRGNTSIADRVEWDNYYIENRSFLLDLKIIALTIPALLRDRVE